MRGNGAFRFHCPWLPGTCPRSEEQPAEQTCPITQKRSANMRVIKPLELVGVWGGGVGGGDAQELPPSQSLSHWDPPPHTLQMACLQSVGGDLNKTPHTPLSLLLMPPIRSRSP